MKVSEDKRVQRFLNDIKDTDIEKYNILQQCRQIVFEAYTDIVERMMYGGIMFSSDAGDFGGIFAYNKHVSFEFSHGWEMNDPTKVLEGSGKKRRHLKLETETDIADKTVAYFVGQTV